MSISDGGDPWWNLYLDTFSSNACTSLESIRLASLGTSWLLGTFSRIGERSGGVPFRIYSPRAIALSISVSSFNVLFSVERGGYHTSEPSSDKRHSEPDQRNYSLSNNPLNFPWKLYLITQSHNEYIDSKSRHCCTIENQKTHEGSGYSLPNLCSSL